MQVQTALLAAIFDKLTRVKDTVNKSDIVVLTSTDVRRLQSVTYNFFGFVVAPLQIVMAMATGVYILGIAGYSIIVGTIAVTPVAWVVCYRFDAISECITRFQQQRLRALTEVLQGVALVKQFALEKTLASTVKALRLKELNVCCWLLHVRVLCTCFLP